MAAGVCPGCASPYESTDRVCKRCGLVLPAPAAFPTPAGTWSPGYQAPTPPMPPGPAPGWSSAPSAPTFDTSLPPAPTGWSPPPGAPAQTVAWTSVPPAPTPGWSPYGWSPAPQVPPTWPPAAPRSRRRPLLLIGAVGAIVALAVGAGFVAAGPHPFGTPGPHTITGALDLYDSKSSFGPSIATDGTSCHGTGGYDDLAPGGLVRIFDDAGDVLASGTIERGVSVSATHCALEWSVANVPYAPTYWIEVTHRGKLEFSHSDLESHGWEANSYVGE